MYTDYTQQEQYFNLRKTILRVLNRWYYILGCILVFTVIAYFTNRYSQPSFQISTTVQVNKSQENRAMSLLYGELGTTRINLTDETILLKSFPVLASTLSELDFGVSYFFGNKISLREMYKNSPIRVSVLPDSDNIPYGEKWECRPIDISRYELKTASGTLQAIYFGDTAEVEGLQFVIDLEKPELVHTYDFIAFQINRFFDNINHYNNTLQVLPLDEKSTIINLTINSKNPEKEIDFLNKLTQKIIQNNLEEKQSNSEKTVEFINQQLAENGDALRFIEKELQTFKSRHATIDMSMEGSQLYESMQTLENEKANLKISNEYYDYLIKSLVDEGDPDKIVVPSSMGIQDPILNQLISTLVAAQMEIRFLLQENKTKNPLVRENQMAIQELKRNILTNVNNQKATNEIRLKDINQRVQKHTSSLKELPQAEQKLINIQRDYKLNENLYVLLMQKKMEAGISGSAVSPDYKVVNMATNRGSISSGPFRNYIAALILGLILPIGFILMLDYFDDKIHSKEELKAVSPFPLLGSVLHLKEKLPENELYSPLFESFRTVRANLRYLAGLEHQGGVLLFTSATSGEGKTFCSRNMAYLLARADKRVVWIDGDMRKPHYAKEKDSKRKNGYPQEGLSSYLAGFSELDNIIKDTNLPGFKVIGIGELPPNPSELLLNSRMAGLIEALKANFDYVVIDTPPLGMISDALELIPLADHTVLVARQKFTKAPPFRQMQDILLSKHIKNIALILNDVKDKKAEKGYSYFYAHDSKKLLSKV